MDEPFSDNWTYLRVELNWLDRVLANAIARQRKETKAIDRVSKARADQITSHWWKGLLQIEGAIASDSPAEMPRRGTTKVTYQQQLEARLAASHKHGIVLGLPSLCDRLELSTFEKNLLLIALAPEVSRRYGRIYNFLQETDHPGASGLPTIDLILRLLCRNDTEWRSARFALSVDAKLLKYGVIVLPEFATEPFLSHPVKLADRITEYLLADAPQLKMLDLLLHHDESEAKLMQIQTPSMELWQIEQEASLEISQPPTAIVELPPPPEDLWAKLVLPNGLRKTLQHLSDRVRYATQVDEVLGFAQHTSVESVAWGVASVFAGQSGTGKTLAARAIAQSLNVPLVVVNLALLEPSQNDLMLRQLTAHAPTVLLLKSAEQWFGRSATIAPAKLRQFLNQRCHSHTITCLSVESSHHIKASWQPNLTLTVNFPLPNKANRLHLWKQAFPPDVALAQDINWPLLSQWTLSGGAIQAIAREAAIFALAEPSTDTNFLDCEIEMRHIVQGYDFRFNQTK